MSDTQSSDDRARDMIRRMPDAFDARAAGDLRMTVQYAIEAPMYVVVDRGRASVHEGRAPSPDVTLIINGDDLVKLLTGQIYGLTAFLTGRLKVDGDKRLAQKLQKIFDREQLV